ncbi:MAG: gliding motility-associated C-terminal domain-containing protein [Chitinophagales bacterium]|nr:gliding motility-associated C-terminal domain-containing protein [Chitinophagales bacterium]
MAKAFILLLLVLSNTVYAQVDLTQGLVAYYPFTGNANDASGNNNNPSFNNATLTADRFGNPNSAYSFNGIDNYIRIPNNPSLNPANQITICAWVKVNGFYQGTCHGNSIVMKGDGDFLPGNYAIRFDDNPFTNGQNCSSPYIDENHENFYGNNLMSAPPGYTPYIQKGIWYSVVYTSDGVTSKLYVNCELKISAPADGITFSNSYDLFLGRLNDPTYPYWFNGVMDEVRIYDRALNVDEVKAYGGCSNISCNNWLRTTNQLDAVKTGDIDISGDQLTIEATFNRITPYTGGYLYGGDLVSKHSNTLDCNYLLRANLAEITTTNGFYLTPPICEISLNKTYHVAMTYDGITLKFYRDGFLMSQVPASGNLVLNNWITTIGDFAPGILGLAENMNGYINEVRVWNVVRTQTEIQSYMNSSLPSPATQPGLLAYYIFDDLTNKQGNAAYDGTLAGAASINATNPDCDFIADSCQVSCNTKNDFIFQQSTCDPLSIEFKPSSISFDSIGWDFGDGITLTNNSNPAHTYSDYGNYTVKMISNIGTCHDTLVRAISITVSFDNDLIKTRDTSICLGTSKQLLTSPSLNFCWSPIDYLDDPNSSSPVTSSPRNITYYYTAKVEGGNLIKNGNFDSGNTDFTSDYQYSASGLPPGVFFVGTNPSTWNPGMPACKDHTTGNGNMMLVNGTETDGVAVWSETITVLPNTNYAFSTWIQNISNTNPARLQFSVNNTPLGDIFEASTTSCLWEQFYIVWNSGNNNTATISIINKNTLFTVNDFALDDISFSPIYIKMDSVIITVDSPYVKTSNDTTFCAGEQIQLYTTGASTYSWSPATGLSNSNIPNPVASPVATTNYIVTGIDPNGCTSKDSVLITVNPKPVITRSNDTLICKNTTVQLFAGGGTTYSWSPSATLNDPNSSNPVATPPVSTEYYVTVTDANSCTNTDSVRVNIRPDPVFFISPPANLCENNSVQLAASGGDIYAWQPSASLDNTNSPNPIASPGTTTTYSVQITETTCNNSKTLSTTITVVPSPVVHASKSNDVDCSNDASNLSATGAVSYSWSPAATLNDPNIQNPIARPTATTLYTVKGTDANGCTNVDTVTVYVNGTNKGAYLMPNAFTPNNDGKNDCYGIKYWGIIQELDFSIYNRWGQLIFHANQPGQCWDGTYKGVPQNPDVYIYMIKAKTTCDQDVFQKGTFMLIR